MYIKLYMYRVIQYIQYLEEMLLKVCRLIGSYGEVESMLWHVRILEG